MSITYECQRLWEPPHAEFSFNLSWTVPLYLLYDNVIINFTITPKLKDGNQILNEIEGVIIEIPKVEL